MLYTGDYKEHSMITWHINDNCNFNCDYCDEWLNQRIPSPINVSRLTDGLSSLGKDWIFLITGGEPFFEGNIIEICHAITNNHLLALNTNLTLANIFEFGDQVDPQRTLFINAAVHIQEREKTDKDLRAYVQKMHYLQERGFHVIAYYIVHPATLHRVKPDIDRLKSEGINKIRIKIFRGVYQGKYYPVSFTDEEDDFIRTFEADWPELALLDEIPGFKGKKCLAGSRFYYMYRNGNLRRCSGVFQNYGNLFEKSMRIDAEAKPCPRSNCAALYEGIRNSLSESGKISFIDGLQLMRRYQQIKSVVVSPRKIMKLKDNMIRQKALP